MVYLAGRSTFNAEEKRFLAGLGRQGDRGGVRSGLPGRGSVGRERSAASCEPGLLAFGDPLYKFAGFLGYGWLALVAVVVLLAAVAGFGRMAAGWLGWTFAVLALLVEIMFTVYRDGVRDLTLMSKGFDVWNRTVVTNWSVVGLFLVLFVGSLGVVGWLISVVARAQKTMEGVAQ